MAPYNYPVPGSSPGQPSYPTVSSNSAPPSLWRPPAGYPARPSAPVQPAQPESEPIAHQDAGGHRAELSDAGAAAQPVDRNPEGPADAQGADPGDAAGTGSHVHDPVLPGFIELWMFQDPEPNATQEQETAEEPEAAWMARSAWPSAIGQLPETEPAGVEEPAEADSTASHRPVEASWAPQPESPQEQPRLHYEHVAPEPEWPSLGLETSEEEQEEIQRRSTGELDWLQPGPQDTPSHTAPRDSRPRSGEGRTSYTARVDSEDPGEGPVRQREQPEPQAARTAHPIARIRAAEEAVLFQDDLSYVLVDDQGRPVL